jgi:PEGA domain
MADDKGSDLDVFEGLTKKKSSGPTSMPPATIRGTGAPSGVPLPPPKRSSGSAIPIPKPPPSKRSSALPKPKPPPSRGESEAPSLSIKPASVSGIFDEPSSSANVLPGSAVADLDWDDDEEATNVFDRSASDLFGDLAGPSRSFESVAPSAKPNVGRAAALLASSGKSAKAIKSTPPPAALPRIPAPAPVPREIADSKSDSGASARAPHPSWAPSEAAPAKKDKKSSGSTFLLAAIAMVVMGVAAFLYLRSSSDATVVINVTHEGTTVDKANIYIDGQRKCEFAPCTVKVPPGTKSVRVVSGNLAGSKTIDVKGGEDQNVAIVLGVSDELAPPELSASASASSAPEKTGPATLKLSSKMKDAKIKVFINGEEKGVLGSEPLEIKDLEAGKVTLRFEGGDKYGKVEKNLMLEPGETLEVPDIELPLLEILAKFDLKTRGADVKLFKEDDKGKKEEVKLAFRGNKAEAKLDTNFKYTLVGALKGYDEFEKILDFDGVGEKMDVPIELAEEAKEPPPVAAVQPPTSSGKKPPPPSDGGAKFGIINANSLPPAGVIIDGRPHGTAPVTGVKVSPGSHTVVFRHATLGTKSRTVTVAAGKTATAAVRFDPASATSSKSDSGKKKKKKSGKKKKKKKKKKKS